MMHGVILENGTDADLVNLVCEVFGSRDERIEKFFHSDITVFEKFLVKDAEELIAKINLKPLEGDRKVFIIKQENISKVVQNKLLKTLEEPPKDSYIIFVAKNRETFLPTILSRVQVVRKQSTEHRAQFAEEIIENMKTSKDVLSYSRKFSKLTKEKLDEILTEFEVMFEREIKTGDIVIAGWVEALKKAKQKMMLNVNPNGILDLFLMELLEVKHNVKFG